MGVGETSNNKTGPQSWRGRNKKLGALRTGSLREQFSGSHVSAPADANDRGPDAPTRARNVVQVKSPRNGVQSGLQSQRPRRIVLDCRFSCRRQCETAAEVAPLFRRAAIPKSDRVARRRDNALAK